MGEWVEGVWEWKWVWRRELFERERSSLSELLNLINRYKLRENTANCWKWNLSSDGIYSTKIAYEYLILNEEPEEMEENHGAEFRLVWNRITPHKVAAMAWRTLWDRLPTRTNLERRSILSSNETSCLICGLTSESADLVFIHCIGAKSIWRGCLQWMNIDLASHSNIKDHFVMFSGILLGKRGITFSVCLWEYVVWIIWKTRNKLIFEGVEFNSVKILEEIKARLWSWILAKNFIHCNASLNSWLANPLYILKIWSHVIYFLYYLTLNYHFS